MKAPVRPPRTVLVAHPSADLYGSDRVLLESVEGMLAEGWDVVVTVPSAGPLVPELRRRGARVELCRAPVLRRSVLRPRGLVGFVAETGTGALAGLRLLRRLRPSVLYVNTVTLPLWLALARVVRCPTLCHVHEAEQSAPAHVQRLMALPLLLASRIVVNSRFTREVLLASLPRVAGRTTTVYNAVAAPDVVVPARDDLDGEVRLLYVGRLSPRKGPDIALEALHRLVARGVQARLDVVGDTVPGQERFLEELLARAGAAGLGDRVRMHGYQPDIWPHLRRADVLLVPSRAEESFGNTAVEAVLAARPLVVSDSSGLREAAEGYGCVRYVTPGDADALVEGISDVVHRWADVRASAEQDAMAAAARHSPARYRAELVQTMSPLLGGAS